jgi:hypothetical protein
MKPASITFTGTVEFTPGCTACSAAVQRFVASALAQSNVRQVTLRASCAHAHEVEEAPKPTPLATDAATLFPSDTNGSHPEDVHKHMQALL